MNKKMTALMLGLSMFFALPAMADEYADCMKEVERIKAGDFEIALCMKAQSARMLKKVQDEYSKIANMKFFQEWNDGNGMFKGNVRDTYNAWYVYRNKYCDLYALATTESSGSKEYNREKCRLDLTDEQFTYITAIIHNRDVDVD